MQSLGHTIGYHRFLTHRAVNFKSPWLERFIVFLGCSAAQLGPLWWCSIHRYHDQFSETPQDPHNPRLGFLFSHVLWLFYLDMYWKIPGAYEKYKEKFPDIYEDPFYRWLDKYFYIPVIIFFIIFYVIGGWPWVLWGVFIPIVLNFHATWALSSLGHVYGYKTFLTCPETDRSANNWFLALITFGEGWHNNHHTFPSSAKNGFFNWWEFDLSYVLLLVFKTMPLVDYVALPKQSQIEAQRIVPCVGITGSKNPVTH